ncbi:MAG: universal stress protein, partial [Bosea sp.]|uniref:universal stress protein n=1 Tax=Bosea sp. (in: a-proteobacteria) TaxID=1871050 RepID=UPI00238B9432|nr:universal stress protein [Bosea sp. (in: a-proteobacteria)]
LDLEHALCRLLCWSLKSHEINLESQRGSEASIVFRGALQMVKPRKSGAKLIVMGSRGRSGLPRLLLGSHAQRVVQLAPVPVTIVKRRNS